MRGWLRLGVVALCVALTPAAAYAQAPSSAAADEFGAGTGFNQVTGQVAGVELSQTKRPAATQPDSFPPIDLLSLLVTVVAASALLATGVVLHHARSRHGHERQELVRDENAAVPMFLQPADRTVYVPLLDRVQRYSHHACDERRTLAVAVQVVFVHEVRRLHGATAGTDGATYEARVDERSDDGAVEPRRLDAKQR
jgi:hypothetical protein